MERSESYNTRQKNVILGIIKKQKKEFTVKDIYNQLKDSTGLTTIYRLIDKLVEEGRVSKNIDTNNITHYQYLEECNEENHFYLKCERCKDVVHIDCDCIQDLSHHISRKHKFKVNREHIIINGICEKCSSLEKNI